MTSPRRHHDRSGDNLEQPWRWGNGGGLGLLTADGRLINGGEGEEIGSLYRARIGKPEGNGEPEMHDARIGVLRFSIL